MNSGEFPQGEQSVETEISHGSIEAKEIMGVLAEMREDEKAVVEIIEDALNMPIPDLDDHAAVDEFNHRMAVIKELVHFYGGRSELLVEMSERIEGKLKKASQKHGIS